MADVANYSNRNPKERFYILNVQYKEENSVTLHIETSGSLNAMVGKLAIIAHVTSGVFSLQKKKYQ